MGKRRRSSASGGSGSDEGNANVGPWLAFAGTVIAAAITAYATIMNQPAQTVVTQTNTTSSPAAATPPVSPTSSGSEGADARNAPPPSDPPRRSGSQPASSTIAVAGTWTGLHTSDQAREVVITFGRDSRFSLVSVDRGATVAAGSWSLRGKVVHVEARHFALGSFTCDLAATSTSIKGDCSASGKYAGSIDLTRQPDQSGPVA